MRVKICGLRTAADVAAAAGAGASYVGFVFFEKSPRNVTLAQAADLAVDVPIGVAKVALVVNAETAFLDALTQQVPLDMLQLHGAESPERVTDIKARYGLPVMKAIGISDAGDLGKIETYSAVADQLLIEAKPPKGSDRPGGNGVTMDWRLLADRKYWTVPWMLAGGLDASNVAKAVRATGAQQVDVSSGVECATGVKDAGLMQDFMQAALSAQ